MTDLARATFQVKDSNDPFEVHFNPASLDYTITNTLQGGNDSRSAQYVSQSSGKLAMELIFDTTGSGEDVRIHTEKVAKLMEPGGGQQGQGQSQGRRPPPPIAVFEWGTMKFEGIVETYREKIDFFSSDGVPLRATVSLTMSRQDHVFERKPPRPDPAADTVEAPVAPGQPVEDVAGRAGDPEAAGQIAEENGFESLRSPGAAVVRLGPSVALAPPVTFAGGGSLGAGVGFGAGASFGAAAGLDVDFSGSASIAAAVGLAGASDAAGMSGALLQASVDLGIASAATGGVSGGATGGGAASGGAASGVLAGAFGARTTGGGSGTTRRTGGAPTPRLVGTGGSRTIASQAAPPPSPPDPSLAGLMSRPVQTGGTTAAGSEKEQGLTSAGVAATEGAFDALKLARGYRRHRRLDPQSVLRSTEIRGYGTGAGAGFRIGGQATMLGAASVASDVGQEVRLSDRIRFDRNGGGDER